MRNLKENFGVSLLLGLGFSLALLTTASLISSALVQTQKNIRSIEDVTIAFFAAEAGIEQALYYRSFHKPGFDSANTPAASFQGYTKFLGAGAGNGNIDNTGYTWTTDSQINDTQCATNNYNNADDQCRGKILFGKSATLNFAYDNNPQDQTDSLNEVHETPDGTTITFTTDPEGVIATNFHSGNGAANGNGDKIVMSWLGSFLHDDTDGDGLGNSDPFDPDSTTETRILPSHDADTYLGRSGATGENLGDDGDCSIAPADGMYICQAELYDIETTPFEFVINGTTNGFFENIDTDPRDLQSFYAADVSGNMAGYSDRKLWRKLKFFYLNLIPGENADDPAMDTIYYTIEPAPTLTMTGTKSIITAKGRHKNIITELTTTLDNTQEFTALDYSILLE